MMLKYFAVVSTVALVLSSNAAGQNCEQLRQLKTRTYDFHPAKLNDAQRDKKSKEMDVFWEAARRSSDAQCIVELLRTTPDGEFFLFDGSALLVDIQKTKDSAIEAVKAIKRSDLNDINVEGYIGATLQLHRLGADTGPLAVKLFTAPKVTGFVPLHSLTIDRDVAGFFLFGSLSPEECDKYLLPLVNSPRPEIREAAIRQTAFSMTPASFEVLQSVDRKSLPKALRGLVEDTLSNRRAELKIDGKPEYNREQVLDRLARFPDDDEGFDSEKSKALKDSLVLTLKPEDVPLLRAARARSFRGVSDESLYRYHDMTGLLATIIDWLGLYSDQRGKPVSH